MDYVKRNLKRIVPTIVLVIGVLVAFYLFIQDNTQRIERQNEEYLEELTTQRAASIDNLVAQNLTFIESTAYLYGNTLSAPEADVGLIRDYEANSTFDMLRFVDAAGDNYTSDGLRANLADRDYFQAGMQGESGVTYVLESKVTGQKQIGFYAPVRFEGEIIGIMVGFYGEDYVDRLLDYDLFGYGGEGWLCAADGTVLGSTLETDPDNLYAYLADEGKCSEAEVEHLSDALRSGQNLSFTYEEGGEQATGYAVALGQVDWALVRNFPPSASDLILNNANREGSVLLAELLALFVAYGIVMAIGVIVDQRRVRAANRNANDISAGVRTLFETFVIVDLPSQQYSYISGKPVDPDLPMQGRYERFCTSLLGRIPEQDHREEVARALAPESLEEALADSSRLSLRVHAPAGEAHWFTYNFIVIEREGASASRLLVIRQDVTDLHDREEEEQQRLQHALDLAENASRAKTEFLFNMSHDLRTPMNAIIGYTELAQREGVTEDEMRDFVGKIDSSSAHLLALINDILEMSRIESGKVTLEPSPTDIVALMDDARALFSTQMEGKGIAFSVDASDVRDRWVLCDKGRLNRVLLNLVSNAWKFTGEGGLVAVTLDQVGKDDPADGQAHFVLRVKDSGIGMSPEFVSRVFSPFERERTSTVSKTQGTGLGLSISKSFVELMGGSIEVKTEKGKGTEFIVELAFPLTDEQAVEKQAEADEGPAASFEGLRLLLVEDNDINREIATMILEQSGFVLESAGNGQEALDMVADSQPGYYAAVLMDIQMPVMDGYAASRAIRALEDEQLAQVPIVAMTANAFAEDVQAAIDAGMNAHIAKPLDVPKMLATLASVLSGREGLSA